MKREQAYYRYATYFLLLLNLAVLGTWWWTAGPPQSQAARIQHAINVLKLDPNQATVFRQSVERHVTGMQDLRTTQQQHLEVYFAGLTQPETLNEQDRAALLEQLQTLERKKIEQTYQHFVEIKALLKPEQEEAFKRFVDHVLRKVLLGGKKKHSKPKEK